MAQIYGLVLWCSVLALCRIVHLEGIHFWGHQPQFPSSKIPDDALNTSRSVVRKKIVLHHNFFRMKVEPSASNMLYMSWHVGAAKQAQRYAEQCIFLQHNSPLENIVPRLGICGQNLFVAAQKTPWFFAIKTWFLEYQNFTYGSPIIDLKAVGHYTQMVWATSFKVGCGMAKCSGGPWGQFYNYVCHYCPGGNYDTITQFPYKAGKPCSDCPGQCVNDKLCMNSCPARDVFNNCRELLSLPGLCEQGTCNATCNCGDSRIHKNYPF